MKEKRNFDSEVEQVGGVSRDQCFLSRILKCKLVNRKINSSVYKILIRPVVTYDNET